ncbi:MAG: hypothetical protein K6G10_01565 [Butyrivibrio sp.]|nr:hypothetical protein [Butyrivibrio sp.]
MSNKRPILNTENLIPLYNEKGQWSDQVKRTMKKHPLFGLKMFWLKITGKLKTPEEIKDYQRQLFRYSDATVKAINDTNSAI